MFSFLPLTRWWLKFWEEGLVEVRMLNGNRMLVMMKCEVWGRGGLIRFVTNKEMGHLFCGFTVHVRQQ